MNLLLTKQEFVKQVTDGLGEVYDCSVVIDQEMKKEITNNTAERKF